MHTLVFSFLRAHPPHSWLPAEKRVTAARIHLDPAETARTELCSDPKIYRPKLKNTRMELSSAEEWTAHVSHVKGVKMKQTCPIMVETVRTMYVVQVFVIEAVV